MHAYETIYILQPELTEEDVETLAKGFEEVLAAGKSEVTKSERWGKKRLGYRVKRFWEGYYLFLEHSSTPGALAELERRLRIHEHVIKWMSVRKDPRAAAEEERRAARLAKMQQRAATSRSDDDDDRHRDRDDRGRDRDRDRDDRGRDRHDRGRDRDDRDDDGEEASA